MNNKKNNKKVRFEIDGLLQKKTAIQRSGSQRTKVPRESNVMFNSRDYKPRLEQYINAGVNSSKRNHHTEVTIINTPFTKSPEHHPILSKTFIIGGKGNYSTGVKVCIRVQGDTDEIKKLLELIEKIEKTNIVPSNIQKTTMKTLSEYIKSLVTLTCVSHAKEQITASTQDFLETTIKNMPYHIQHKEQNDLLDYLSNLFNTQSSKSHASFAITQKPPDHTKAVNQLVNLIGQIVTPSVRFNDDFYIFRQTLSTSLGNYPRKKKAILKHLQHHVLDIESSHTQVQCLKHYIDCCVSRLSAPLSEPWLSSFNILRLKYQHAHASLVEQNKLLFLNTWIETVTRNPEKTHAECYRLTCQQLSPLELNMNNSFHSYRFYGVKHDFREFFHELLKTEPDYGITHAHTQEPKHFCVIK